MPENWREIDVLVNNAGLSRGIEPLQRGDVGDWEEMIDTNVKGLLYVTRAVLPGMVERGRGHVINIGSIAGHEVYPGGNVYCATKHAVTALNRGLAIDTLGTGVRVSSVDPGMVETEFSVVRFHGDQQARRWGVRRAGTADARRRRRGGPFLRDPSAARQRARDDPHARGPGGRGPRPPDDLKP